MAGRKKIVCTVTNDLTYDQRMNRICDSLQQNGYDVLLVGFMKKRSVKLEQRSFKQVRFRLLFTKGKLFFLEYNFRLFWFLLFRKFDMYCGIDLDTLIPVYLVAKWKRKPCIYDAHEYYTELPEIVGRPAIKWIWSRVEKWLLPRIRYNYTVGFSIADALHKKYKQPYSVIRNVPVLEAEENQQERKNFILYQGALNTGRGLEQLMTAMADIDAQLYIAGEGDLSAELRRFAAALPHAAKIRFLGYVRPAALKTYTREAKVGVNFIENKGLSYYYSLSNKFFDYIHAGLPQVTMAFPEYVRLNAEHEVALLIETLDPAHISAAVNRLLQDDALYKTLQIRCNKAKLELNWQEEEKKLIEFYKAIG